jgi:hypothetical protein
MESRRFDALVRSIDLRAPRRAALTALGGGLAALLLRHNVDNAEAKKKHKHKKKRKKKTCKSGTKKCGTTCVPTANCCANADCGEGAICQLGTCICPDEGDVACGQSCVDLATDPSHCGACGHACMLPNSSSCFHGACECSGAANECPAGCTCAARFEGGFACTGGKPIGQECGDNEDCPPEKICTPAGVCTCSEDTECPLGSSCFGVPDLYPPFSFCGEPCMG